MERAWNRAREREGGGGGFGACLWALRCPLIQSAGCPLGITRWRGLRPGPETRGGTCDFILTGKDNLLLLIQQRKRELLAHATTPALHLRLTGSLEFPRAHWFGGVRVAVVVRSGTFCNGGEETNVSYYARGSNCCVTVATNAVVSMPDPIDTWWQ